jgi:hypothetical protein
VRGASETRAASRLTHATGKDNPIHEVDYGFTLYEMGIAGLLLCREKENPFQDGR